MDGRKCQTGNTYLCIVSKVCSCLYTWMTSTWLEGTENLDPTWKKWMTHVDLGEPTSFLGHVYLGLTQSQCKPSEGMVDEYRKMLESRISAGSNTLLLSNCTTSPHHVLTTIRSKKKNRRRWENCQRVCSPKNACVWHALVDWTFCGR